MAENKVRHIRHAMGPTMILAQGRLLENSHRNYSTIVVIGINHWILEGGSEEAKSISMDDASEIFSYLETNVGESLRAAYAKDLETLLALRFSSNLSYGIPYGSLRDAIARRTLAIATRAFDEVLVKDIWKIRRIVHKRNPFYPITSWWDRGRL